MNEYTIVVNFSKRVTYFKDNIEPLITGDYNSTKFKFEFDREDGVKIFKLKNPNGEAVALEEIANNEIILKGEDEQGRTCSLFNVDGEYTFEISLYDSQEKNSKLTSVSNTFTVHPEQVPIDSEIVTPQLPIFDQLFSHVQEELEEMEEATEHLVEANTEAERIVSEFESNVEQYTEDFNTNAAEKTNAVNQIKSDVETLVNGFDSNVTAKTTQFNSNASAKLSNYNSNAESKLNEYNTNAESKLSDYNSNATQKTTEFNTNVQEKTDEFNANKEKLQQELERYKLLENALPHVAGAGTELTLNNTANAPMSMVLNSNTSQETTTGKNKLSKIYQNSKTGVTVSEDKQTVVVDFTTSNDMYFIIEKLINDNPTTKAYTVYFEASGLASGETPKYNLWGGGTFFTLKNGKNVATIPSGTTLNQDNIIFDDQQRTSYPVSSVVTFTNFMIVEGEYTEETIGDYEPYTGGIPSPNPSYPQQVHVVTGDNTVKVENKNLCNPTTIVGGACNTSGAYDGGYSVSAFSNTNGVISFTTRYSYGGFVSDYIEIEPNKQYVVSYKVISAENSLYHFYCFYDEDKNGLARNLGAAPADAKYLRIYVGLGGTGTSATITDIQVEKGSTATTYELHEEQIVNIPLGIKNLFSSEIEQNAWSSSNGTSSLTSDKYVRTKTKIAVLPNKTYTLSFDSDFTISGGDILQYGNDQTFIQRIDIENRTFITPNNCYYLNINFYKNTGIVPNDITNIQLEEGPVAHSYSPYGVEPIEYCKIPNSDYKDDFVIPSKKNKININGNIVKRENATYSNIKVSSDTLSYNTTSGVAGYLGFIVPVTIGQIYTLSWSALTGDIRYVELDEIITSINIEYGNHISNGSTITPSKPYLGIWLQMGGNSSASVSKLQLEKGSIVTEYEPYNDGKWYLKKNIRHLSLAIADMNNSDTYPGWKTVHQLKVDYPGVNNTFDAIGIFAISNIVNSSLGFLANTRASSSDIDGILTLNKSYFNLTQTDWQTNYPNLIVELYYNLQNPEYILLNDTLQEALNTLESKLLAFKDQTNITQENNDLPFEIVASALKDISNL